MVQESENRTNISKQTVGEV